MDRFGRQIDYLRISLTDRCNERCRYCLPAGYRRWPAPPDHLQVDEILRVVRVAAARDFRKFRLTGGEPLLRSDLTGLVSAMATLPGVECLGLSTNGTRLAGRAEALRHAGLRTVNISLDALDPVVYRRLTGGDVRHVLAGIRAALAARFECVKLNTVLCRGFNDDQVWPLVLFAAEHQVPLRLIELMPVTRADALDHCNFLPVTEVMDQLRARDTLVPLPNQPLGHGPARYYRLQHTGAVVGFIAALTHHRFCETCNRLRLTADGRLRPCLGDHGEVDVRSCLRARGSDEALAALLELAIRRKPPGHQFRADYTPERPMVAVGG